MTRNYYQILGVPVGASINHIKDSYRLLSKKTLLTDAAYQTLTDPTRRWEYNVQLAAERHSSATDRAEGNRCFSSGDQQLLYEITDLDTRITTREAALASLKEHGFSDRTAEVEEAASWRAFIEANGSGTERYFFSQNNRYLLMIDFSPYAPSGEGWHTLGWWLYFDDCKQWDLIRDGELGDPSLYLALRELRDNFAIQRKGWWSAHGAPREMPIKPNISSWAELTFIGGVEKLLKSGVLLDNVANAILDSTPEELFNTAGIDLPSAYDAELLVKWAW